ncbi:MAG: hypothetical protein JST59_01365 [Actinobacteria bacterium]|nr:hypothetical protein [Actinomycetota bacterium]
MVQLDDRTFDGNLENANVVVYEEIKDGDPKKDGLRYLEFARRIGERMKHRLGSAKKQENSGEGKPRSESQDLLVSDKPKLTKSKRYSKPLSEHEVNERNKRLLNSWADDLKDERLSEQERLERIRVKSMLLDGKARNQ